MMLAFSGSAQSVQQQKKTVLAALKKFGGVFIGTHPGQSWYARKYDYPYLRDLVMDFGCVVDVVETATTWSEVSSLYAAVKKSAYAVLDSINTKNHNSCLGYVGCHLSHHYYNGVCLYFTFCFLPTPNQELDQYWQLKKAMVQTLMDKGAALSHHHSIGYEHSDWLSSYQGELNMDTLKSLKLSLDPTNIFNPYKLNLMTDES